MFTLILSITIFASCAPRAIQAPAPQNSVNPSVQQTPQQNTTQSSMGNMAQYFVYTANEGDSTVSIIDMLTMKVISNIPVGQGPHNVQVTPDRKFVYVVENKSDSISAIDTNTNKVVNSIKLGKGPSHIVF